MTGVFVLATGLSVFLLMRFAIAAPAVDFGNCAFETDLCQWTATGGTVDLFWERQTGSLLRYSDAFLPSMTEGMVAVANYDNSFVSSDDTAYLQSVELRPSQGVCGMRFSYTKGTSLGVFSLYKHVVGLPRMKIKKYASTTSDSTNGYWRREFVPLSVTQPLQMEFELELSSSGHGSAAIDNVQFIRCSVCTLETGLCGWKMVKGVGYTPWTNQKGPTLSTGTGPSHDYTYRNNVGHYLYIEATSTGIETAVLKRSLSISDNICALSFAYHMYGSHVGSLTVTVEMSGNKTVVWQESGDHGNLWLIADIPLGQYISHIARDLVITAQTTTGAGSKSDIAIDDIETLPCPATGLCRFTQGTCDWLNGEVNQLQWKIQESKFSPSPSNILVANLSSPFIANGDHASLRGPSVFPDRICSLSVRYDISKHINTSKLLLLANDTTGGGLVLADLILASRNTGSLMNQVVQVDVSFLDVSMFPVIYAEKANDEMGSIVLLDLEFIPCGYTTFEVEQQFITWHDASANNKSRWSLADALQRQFVAKRPISSDHTYQGYNRFGHYMLNVGMDAQMHATLMTTVREHRVCGIRFWVYWADKNSYKLQIFVRVPAKAARQIYASKGETAIAGKWQYREIVAPIDLFWSEVSFVSTYGGQSLSLLALDDIQLTTCPGFKTCTFETGLCGWLVFKEASCAATWTRWRGSPLQFQSNLTTDHSTQTARGYYLYVETLGVSSPEYVAALKGIPATIGSSDNSVCGISFWYHLGGNASLTVTLQTPTQRYTFFIDSPLAGNGHSTGDNSSWFYAHYRPAKVVKSVGHIQFRAVMYNTSDIVTVALDDITYISCAGTPPVVILPHTSQPDTPGTKSGMITPRAISRQSSNQQTRQASIIIPTTAGTVKIDDQPTKQMNSKLTDRMPAGTSQPDTPGTKSGMITPRAISHQSSNQQTRQASTIISTTAGTVKIDDQPTKQMTSKLTDRMSAGTEPSGSPSDGVNEVPSTKMQTSESSVPVAAIVGAVIGVGVLAAVIVFVVLICVKRSHPESATYGMSKAAMPGVIRNPTYGMEFKSSISKPNSKNMEEPVYADPNFEKKDSVTALNPTYSYAYASDTSAAAVEFNEYAAVDSMYPTMGGRRESQNVLYQSGNKRPARESKTAENVLYGVNELEDLDGGMDG